MAAFVFDASGIVKRYLQEAGTGWVRSLTDPAAGHEIFLTRITLVEVTAAVTRRGRGGTLPVASATALLGRFRQDVAHQYNIVEISPAVLSSAETHGLRAYDAVQLAASAELHRRRQASGLGALTLISADVELNAAATAQGVPTEDPSLHP